MNDLSLVARRTLKATPQAIFDAWLDPAMMAKYMLAQPGMQIVDTMTDPRVGGRFAFTVVVEGGGGVHGGTYLDLVPHTRIHHTWESPYSAPGSTVTLDLAPRADGTEVVLTHVKFTSEGSRDGHEKVWNAILGVLAGLV